MAKVNPHHLLLAICVALLGTLCPPDARAHGDLDEGIAALTEEIAAKPYDAQLYLRRAIIHRLHRDWKAAGADFDRAQELDSELIVVELARGEMLALAGEGAAALAALERYLAKRPADPAGHAARARVLAAAGEFSRAAEEFARASELTKEPEPALLLEHARALQNARRLDEAVRVLDAAVARLGPLITFTQPAFEMELEAGRLDAALTRLAKLIEAAPRKERWLMRRGELLEKAGKRREAREAFRAARAALETVPLARRKTAAMEELAQTIDAGLSRASALPPDAQ